MAEDRESGKVDVVFLRVGVMLRFDPLPKSPFHHPPNSPLPTAGRSCCIESLFRPNPSRATPHRESTDSRSVSALEVDLYELYHRERLNVSKSKKPRW